MLSAEAELAVRRLGGLRAFHEKVARQLADPLGANVDQIGLRTLREAVLVRCMSILEAYVTELGHEVVERRLRQEIPAGTVRTLADYLVRKRWQGARSWPDYEEIWKEGLGLSLGDFREWQQIRITRGARNAIVHQLGEYNQEYRKVARTKLEGMGIDATRASGRIPLDEDDVTDGLSAGRAFVLWADLEMA